MDDWRGNKTLLEKLDDVKKTELCSDFTVKLEYYEENTKKTKIYKLHSFLLILASAVFERMFANNFTEGVERILTLNYKPHHFNLFIDFVYQGVTEFDNVYDAWGVYEISHYYFVEPLKNLCLDYIKRNIDPTNAAFSHRNSKIYDLTEMKNYAKKFIMDNLEDADLNELTKEDFGEILDEPVISIKEVHLFKKLENWIMAKINKVAEPERENLKKYFCWEFIPKIHFFEMTHAEFMDEGIEESEFLTHEQKYSILKNMSSTFPQSLAEGISHFKNKRLIKSLPECFCHPKNIIFCSPSTDRVTSVEFINKESYLTLNSKIKLVTSKANKFSFFFLAKSSGWILSQYNSRQELFLKIFVKNTNNYLVIEFSSALQGNSNVKENIQFKNVVDYKPHFLTVEFFENEISMTLDDAAPITKPWKETTFDCELVLGFKSGMSSEGFTGYLSDLNISHLGIVDFIKWHSSISNVSEFNLIQCYKRLYKNVDTK